MPFTQYRHSAPRAKAEYIVLLCDGALVVASVSYMLYAWAATKYAVPHIGCPFHFLTGIPCPFCGMTRAFGQLLHGNVGQALVLNSWAILLMGMWCIFTVYTLVIFVRDFRASLLTFEP